MDIIRGIDVSSYQDPTPGTNPDDDIHWDKVPDLYDDFALARMSIGRTTLDVDGRRNLQRMIGQVEVPGVYGVCGYSDPVTDGAKLLLDETARYIDPHDALVMVDIEKFKNGSRPTKTQAEAYVTHIRSELGKWPIAYLPGWFIKSYGWKIAGSPLAECPWMQSHYLSGPWTDDKLVANKPDPGAYGFKSLAGLQFTSSLTISGVYTRVDANVYYGTLAQLKTQFFGEDMAYTDADRQLLTDIRNLLLSGNKDANGNVLSEEVSTFRRIVDGQDLNRPGPYSLKGLDEKLTVLLAAFDPDTWAGALVEALAARGVAIDLTTAVGAFTDALKALSFKAS